ncbi:hypothetical protein C8R44DRAFT_868493 [Mycena epipterygia]|nr:hypothetical protein C8R44DRAFT_868493 [Mycena epipterygia]
MSYPTTVLSDADTKLLKNEAIRGAKPFTKGLQIWLDEQHFPPKPAGPPQKFYYKRLHAKLEAKAAHRATLIKMREAGLVRVKRRWPKRYDPSSYSARGKENSAFVGLEVPLVAAADPARDARVAELMRLKHAGTSRRRYRK